VRRIRRWSSALAWVLMVELITAAVVAVHPVPATHPGRGPLLVGDRTVALIDLGGPDSERLLSRIASNVGAAVEKVEVFWGADWSREISAVAAGSDEQFRAAAGGGPASQWADIAAVTVVDRVDFTNRVAVNQRMVFAPGAANMTESALRIVLTHELFHYAARTDTALDAPRWLTEGVADFVARPHTALPVAAVPAAAALPSDADLDAPGLQRSLAYDRAWWFARFVADSYGSAKLRAFYVASCGVGHRDLSTAVRDVLGTDPERLVTAWRQWLTR
jgi:hypothetical protein